MAIDSDWLQLIGRFLSRLYLAVPADSFPACNQRAASSLPHPEHRHTQRDRQSRHPTPCMVCEQSGFWWAASTTARFFLRFAGLTTSSWLLRFAGSTSSSPDERSRDCTANIYLHRLWSANSSNTLCRLVRMKPSVPSTLVPPLDIILNCYVLFSVHLQSYLQCLSLVWLARNSHTCTYLPPACWLYFSRLNQTLKYLKF